MPQSARNKSCNPCRGNYYQASLLSQRKPPSHRIHSGSWSAGSNSCVSRLPANLVWGQSRICLSLLPLEVAHLLLGRANPGLPRRRCATSEVIGIGISLLPLEVAHLFLVDRGSLSQEEDAPLPVIGIGISRTVPRPDWPEGEIHRNRASRPATRMNTM